MAADPTVPAGGSLFEWWRAYKLIAPFGHAADDEHLAYLVASLMQGLTHGKRTGDGPRDVTPWRPADFRLRHGPDVAPSRRPRDRFGEEIMTPEETRRFIAAKMERFGGHDPRYSYGMLAEEAPDGYGG